MSTRRFHVVGIGNAMVDILAHVEERTLVESGVRRGIMQLIDMERAAALYARIDPTHEVSGGSAANTIVGLARLGDRTAYVGKVKDDAFGAKFARDLRAHGVVYETPLAAADTQDKTGRCIVLVTPDGERSMNTYLGVTEHLTPDDVDTAQIAASEWIYLEGYRFDGAQSKAAFAKAIKAIDAGGGKVALTLSDPFCVERHKSTFASLIRAHVDLLFANEHELQAMYPASTLAGTIDIAAGAAKTVVCTRGADGAVVAHGAARWHVPALSARVVDVTGAGDLFAAGFLHGVNHGASLEECARMGCVAAAETIGCVGAHPQGDLGAVFARHGFSAREAREG